MNSIIEASNDDLEAAILKVQQLFDLLNIKKVVCVDDDHEITIDKIFQGFLTLDLQNAQKYLDFPELVNIFEQSDLVKAKLQDLKEHSPQTVNHIVKALGNRIIYNTNPTFKLFESYEILYLTPSEWEDLSISLLEEGKIKKTLFLFDNNLGNGDTEGGIRIIKKVLTNYEGIICGLISNTFDGKEEYTKWKEYVETQGLDKNRFALIAKKHSSYHARAQSIKLIALNEKEHKLIEDAESIIEKAVKAAHNEFKTLDVYDIESMIFSSSINEGVWEFDTLVRLMNILQRRHLTDEAKKSTDLLDTSTNLRKISQINLVSQKLTPKGRKLRQLELYDEGEALNRYFTPLEVGDIFKIDLSNGKDTQSKEFILLTQSCDLMVRENKNGKRSAVQGTIVALSPTKLTDAMLYYELESYSDNLADHIYVDFRHTHVVELSVLDLCVFNSTGGAQILIGGNMPTELIVPWQMRFELLQEEFQQVVNNYNAIHKALKDYYERDKPEVLISEATFLPTISSSLKIVPKIQDGMLTYPVQRIKRLRQPIAGALLTRYAYSTARDAFDHDFTLVRK